MSRIFDALKLTSDDIADAVLPALDDAVAVAVPKPPPLVAEEIIRAAAPRAAEPAVPASAPTAGDAAPGFRVLPLSVPAFSPVLPFDDTNFHASEQYRIVRTRIIQHPSQSRVIVISSPSPGDGKSLTALNVAGVLSLKAAAQVLLVDGDFRRATIHTQTGLPVSPGLADVLSGKCTLEAAVIRTVQFPSLHVLPVGAGYANPAELLDSPQWAALVARLRKMFAYVILDSPPMAAVADYDLIQAVCDGVIVVVRPDHTNRKVCFDLIDRVPKNKLLGVLMNCVTDWIPGRRHSFESYYYRPPTAE